MTRVVLLALLSHWWRNPMQLFTLLSGLALATALWSGVQAVNSEARASYDSAAATLGEGQYDRLLPKDGSPVDQSVYIDLRRAGWLVSPMVEGRLDGQRLIGIDPLTAPGGLGPIELGPDVDLTRFFSNRGQIFANQTTFDQLETEVDVDRVVAPEIATGTILADIGVAQRLLEKGGKIDGFIVSADQPLGRPSLSEVAPMVSRQVAQGGSDIGRLTDSFHLNLTAFGLMSFAVGIFIVNGAIGLAFEQRRPVVRTLRALGVPLGTLISMMAAELFLFALVAGLVGVLLGYVIASMLLPDVAATLRGLYGADVSGTLQLRPSWWLSSLLIALGGTAVAGCAAFLRLARMPLLSSASPRALAVAAGRGAILLGGLAAVLITVAAILAATTDSLLGGFVMLAALLVGAALALPIALDRLLAVGQFLSTGVMSQWFWADTRQQLPGLSLALMALLLAMSANVGVSTMVSSFRLTFVAFLDQRLASELYVYGDDQEQAAAILEYVAPKVDAVLPIQSVKTQLAGQPTEIFGARDHATYRENWTFLSSIADPWDMLALGGGILINEQLARRSDIDVGDAVALEGKDYKVVGIYGDYGNPIGQAILNEKVFNALFPQVTPLRFGLRMSPEGVPKLVAELKADLDLPAPNMINQAGIKGFSLGVFDRTFTVTAALNVLTLAIAGFAILMSLLTLATMRVPQLAPAWAVGVTRRRLGALELIRAALLAVLTTALALPLGLALAWALLAIVNVAAFGWKLPMFLFPLDYLRLGILALLAAAVAAIWPAIRLARTPPSDLLKVFSNER